MNNSFDLVGKREIIIQNTRNISENLLLIMQDEPDSFIGGDIALSTVVKGNVKSLDGNIL